MFTFTDCSFLASKNPYYVVLQRGIFGILYYVIGLHVLHTA